MKTDPVFDDWLDSKPSYKELINSINHYYNESEKLFTPGSLESFHRNRYDLHDAHMACIRRIQEVVEERFFTEHAAATAAKAATGN